jgi:hypothetical protein
MKKMITYLQAFVFVACSALGFSAHSEDSATEQWAYQYVTGVCSTMAPMTAEELKSMGSLLVDGVIEGAFDLKHLQIRMSSSNRAPEDLQRLLESDGFIKGVFACYPHSELARNILALRIIVTNSAASAIGDVAGIVGIFKLFSVTSKLLGSSALWALKAIGISEKYVAWLGKLNVFSNYYIVGDAAYNLIEQAIEKHRIALEIKKSQKENADELAELVDLEGQIQHEIKNAKNSSDLQKYQSQLTRVREMKLRRQNSAKNFEEALK